MLMESEISAEAVVAEAEPDPGAVDEIPALSRLVVLGLQHVMVMYAGAVAVPLVLGHALGLSASQIGLLVSADLFGCGLVTLLQTVGIKGVGLRMPIMMGVTFASIGPMLAIANSNIAAGQSAEHSLQVICGAVLVAGVFGLAIAPVLGKVARFFPPVVTGTVILVIGVSLIGIGVGWIVGQGKSGEVDAAHAAMSFFVLALILAVLRFGKGMVRNAAILIGVAVGTFVAAGLGMTDFSAVGESAILGFTPPLVFGLPRFELGASISMMFVMIIVMVESVGMFFAVSEIVGTKMDTALMTRGLRADGLGTIIGGLFNAFPYTSFSQNIGLIAITGVRSRFVCATGAVIMLGLALSPKLAVAIASIPSFVLGGAGLVMFGMIAATGVRILGKVDLSGNPHNQTILAVSLSMGMVPLVSEGIFASLPQPLQPFVHSGIVLATISAVALNWLLNKERR